MESNRYHTGGGTSDRYHTEPKPKPKRKRVSKAQALVDYGLADNLADARAMLRDMGE
jgi:hypothetical protein